MDYLDFIDCIALSFGTSDYFLASCRISLNIISFARDRLCTKVYDRGAFLSMTCSAVRSLG